MVICDFLPLSRGRFDFLLLICDYPYNTIITVSKVGKILKNPSISCGYVLNIVTRFPSNHRCNGSGIRSAHCSSRLPLIKGIIGGGGTGAVTLIIGVLRVM